ncbi:PepSY domain-containing protein [Alteromonas sp. a30]|uniref:PepSY domain-containing protein n=1 Tax=Alteromonas sp. a30 TaxID=2730917 RepID=UPI00227F7A72|nr:PepSY domain-containing protein [Alteromonas sp. a30]MCY7294767.1 PepSY domain-containing protein [Alteromonas sp. a30]
MPESTARNFPNPIRLIKLAYPIHRWSGLILGVQLLFWILGGFIMALLPLEQVHGRHLAKAPKLATNAGSHSYSLDILLRQLPDASHIELSYVDSQPTYLITTPQGRQLFDAQSGEKKTALNKETIKRLAQEYYLKTAAIEEANLLDTPPHEASRVKGKVWQVNFDDAWNTRLYLDPLTGSLLNTRSTLWRIFDFVWMLHIMDYDTRNNINNPLLILFSGAATLFTLSGFILLYGRFRPFKSRKRRIKKATA